MKKIIFAAFISLSSLQLFAADPGVDEKVLNAFNKTFQNASNVTWTTLQYTYEVRFEQDKITSKLTYDKDGAIIKSLRYYGEDQLPLMLLTKIKTRFSDKKIFGVVEESSTEEGICYHVTLEDEKQWMEVKADIYGALTVVKKFKKA